MLHLKRFLLALAPYFLSLVVIALSILLKLYFRDQLPISDSAFLFTIWLVLPATWYGGWKAGVFAGSLSLIGVWYFFLTPGSSNDLTQSVNFFKVLLLSAEIVVMVLFVNKFKNVKHSNSTLITALQSSEEKFYLLAQKAQGYTLFFVDQQGLIQDWNESAEKLFGWKIEEMTAQPLIKLAPSHKHGDMTGLLVRAQKKGHAELELFLQRKNGTTFWSKIVATHLVTSQGISRGFGVVCGDRTIYKQLEHERNEFLDIASHELKTPLTSIKLFSQLIGRELSPKQVSLQTMFKKLDIHISALNNLVSLMLDLSKIEASRLQLNLSSFNITQSLKELPEKCHVPFSLKVPTTDYEVIADKKRLSEFLCMLIEYVSGLMPEIKTAQVIVHPLPTRTLVSVVLKGTINTEEYKKLATLTTTTHLTPFSQQGAKGLYLYAGLKMLSLQGGKLKVAPYSAKQLELTITLPTLTS